eukprot:6180128-Pleurochrysis_carterae.AAC.1
MAFTKHTGWQALFRSVQRKLASGCTGFTLESLQDGDVNSQDGDVNSQDGDVNSSSAAVQLPAMHAVRPQRSPT